MKEFSKMSVDDQAEGVAPAKIMAEHWVLAPERQDTERLDGVEAWDYRDLVDNLTKQAERIAALGASDE